MKDCLEMKLSVAFVLLGLCSASEFSYEGSTGPEYWSDSFPNCSGIHQSPINIPGGDDDDDSLVALDDDLVNLEFRNYSRKFNGIIENNGHTIEVHIPEDEVLTLAYGGLSSVYRAAQFHFHWGSDDTEGSEHTLNGEAFPLEMHVVHYNEDYGSLRNALNKSDGLAVVSFLFQISPSDNANYADLVDALQNLTYSGSHRTLNGVNLSALTLGYLPDGSSNGAVPTFFRYKGSLTTPPCSETVTWTIIREFVQISSSQVAAFRQVAEVSSGTITLADRIKHNFRPVQPLNGRTVFSSVEVDDK